MKPRNYNLDNLSQKRAISPLGKKEIKHSYSNIRIYVPRQILINFKAATIPGKPVWEQSKVSERQALLSDKFRLGVFGSEWNKPRQGSMTSP